MGKSPDDIRQVMETESSKLAGSSPKSKALILGGTADEMMCNVVLGKCAD